MNFRPLPATIEHRCKPESACLFMALSSRRRVMPCARIRFVPKCIRPPSVLTKRNFISRRRNETSGARKRTVPGIPGKDFDRGFTSFSHSSIQFRRLYLSAMDSVINDFANQPFVIAPRRCIIKGTVTISVRNEQFQIGARGTKREREKERTWRLSQAPIGSAEYPRARQEGAGG